MPAKPSKVMLGAEAGPVTGGLHLEAFGDSDDHLRLVTLIALALQSEEWAHDAAQACLQPTAAWSAKVTALSQLLTDRAGHDAGPTFVLRDPDALSTSTSDANARWNDREFRRERAQLLDLLLEHIGEGGWLVVRPRPTAEITQALASIEVAPVSPVSDERLALVAPDCRPVLQWLLDRGHVSPTSVDELLEEAEIEGDDVEDHLLRLAYDALPPSVRNEAHWLTVARAPVERNGLLGPFGVAAQGAAHVISAKSLAALEQAGFLQATGQPGANGHPLVRMPRSVRRLLTSRAELVTPERLVDEHRFMAGAAQESPDGQLERHFHAVRGLDESMAVKTAVYYGNDLRELAFRLSANKQWAAAASVYRTIVDRFDPEDAYAWEYLGYNLARLYPKKGNKDEILRCYDEARTRDPQNPLYHGRWLGFRAQLGEDIVEEFEVAMRRYGGSYGRLRLTAMDWFATQVLQGLDLGRHEATRQKIEARWGGTLKTLRAQRLR